MNGLTVAKKILLSFAVLIIFFAGFGFYANKTGHELNTQTSNLNDWTSGLAIGSNLADAANEAFSQGSARFMGLPEERQSEITSDLTAAYAQVDAVFAEYEKMLAETEYASEEERKTDLDIINNEKALWKAYREETAKAAALLQAGDSAGALAQFDGNARTAYKKFIEAVKADEETCIKKAEDTLLQSNALYEEVFFTTVLLMIVVLTITILAAIWLGRTISAGVDCTLGAMKAVAAGDLRQSLDIQSGDEFGQIAAAFNTMLENVRKMTKQIQTTAENVAEASGSLMNTSEQSAQATQNVAESITQVAGAAHEQMASLEATKAQVDSFRQSIGDATKLLDSIVNDVQNTAKRAGDGNTLVRSTVDQMNMIADGVESASGVVSKLGERSKEIGDIVEVIASISAQTNLLALNAAIEAARAGEHGRGFAVVAEEVRKLAEESSRASQKISDLIRAIQQETDAAVAAMQEGHDQAEEGRENVRATGESFSEILSMIQQVSENSKLIQQTMTTLNENVGQIADSTAKIHDSAKQVAYEAENVSATTEEQAAGITEIASGSRGLSDHADELKSAAGRFKT